MTSTDKETNMRAIIDNRWLGLSREEWLRPKADNKADIDVDSNHENAFTKRSVLLLTPGLVLIVCIYIIIT